VLGDSFEAAVLTISGYGVFTSADRSSSPSGNAFHGQRDFSTLTEIPSTQFVML